MSASDWRAALRKLEVEVHPEADRFPMMSDAELGELGEDIQKNGLRHKPVFWRVGNRRFLIDGRNRVAALLRLDGAMERLEELCRETLENTSDANATSLDPHSLVLSLNVHRRHLTREQKHDLVAHLLQRDPGQSDRAVAAVAKVDHKTAANVRNDLQRRGEIPHVSRRTDVAGRVQPATKATQARPSPRPRPEAPKPGPTPSPTLCRDRLIRDLCVQLKRDLPRTLDDLVRLMRDEHGRIVALPREKRVTVAQGYLRGLGFVPPNDLKDLL